MDVGGWLRSLGLERYEAGFRENDIDETVLPNLTHETLKDLGVTTVGHRLKLLDAIVALRGDASAKAPFVDVATPSNSPDAPPEDRAERRQVTVMFSDCFGQIGLVSLNGAAILLSASASTWRIQDWFKKPLGITRAP
jgi:hypothetical protein